MTEPLRATAAGALQGAARTLFKNALSQIVGRLLLSLGRLGAALLIVRLLGRESFGTYALVINLVVLFEFLSDFGQTDLAVRDASQQPARESIILGALVWLKAISGVVFGLALPGLLFALGYPEEIVRSGAVGGVSVLFYAGAQVFRARLKLCMCMERDIGAELMGLAVMLPLTWYACRAQAGTEALVGCYAAARGVFFLLIAAFARAPADDRQRGPRLIDALALFRQALPVGLAGLLVAVYDTLATVVLSKLTDMAAVAEYAAATRFVFPIIIVVQSLNAAFFPPLAAHWRASPPRFGALQQAALETSLMLGGGLFCGVFGGAEFLMGMMGPEIGSAAPVLRLMTFVILARAITTCMSPLILIGGRQTLGLWLGVASVLLQTMLQLALVPRFGITGAVLGYLVVELILGILPVSYLGQRVTGVRLRWSVPVRIVACAIAAGAAGTRLPTDGTFWGGVITGVIYLVAMVASGCVSVRRVQGMVAALAPGRPASTIDRAVG